MRINRIALENFRCFRQVEIDLSADVIAIYGRNGVGKTAIFDALEFALLGSIGRFDQESTGPPYYLPHVLSDDNSTIRVGFKGDTDDWVKLDIDRANFNVQIESSGNWRSHSELLYDFFVNEHYFPPRRDVSRVAELFRFSPKILCGTLFRVMILPNVPGSCHILPVPGISRDVLIKPKTLRKRQRKERDRHRPNWVKLRERYQK
jgi:hypothetical protein